MPLRICVYEDSAFNQFNPLALLHPISALRAGILPLFRRPERAFPDARICLAVRFHLATLVADTFRDYPVNIVQREDGDVLFLNARVRAFGDLPQLVAQAKISTQFLSGTQTVGVLFRRQILGSTSAVATPDAYLRTLTEQRDEIPTMQTKATVYGHIWDLMADIEHEIEADFRYLNPPTGMRSGVQVHPAACIIGEERMHLGDGVKVSAGAVIDATAGPVFIGDLTKIEPQAAVFGPCYIGPNSVVVAGKISGSSIGHTSRVGGEVEECVFQSYVNKYHAGFIGHSYVGSWVNFGAMTTNSDLKNNYSTIRVSVNGEEIDTGSIKVGSFIGDHTKFGIGTLLNTGINIGVCCNVFGGSLVVDKEVPSFRWGSSESWQEYRFDKAVETARRTAGRRNVDLSDAEEAALERISRRETATAGVVDFDT